MVCSLAQVPHRAFKWAIDRYLCQRSGRKLKGLLLSDRGLERRVACVIFGDEYKNLAESKQMKGFGAKTKHIYSRADTAATVLPKQAMVDMLNSQKKNYKTFETTGRQRLYLSVQRKILLTSYYLTAFNTLIACKRLVIVSDWRDDMTLIRDVPPCRIKVMLLRERECTRHNL